MNENHESIAVHTLNLTLLEMRLSMKSLEEIQQIKDEVEMDLFKYDGVTAVDIGPKYVGGEKTDIIAIRIYVVEKKDVPEEDTFPREIQGVPTDVQERRFTLHND